MKPSFQWLNSRSAVICAKQWKRCLFLTSSLFFCCASTASAQPQIADPLFEFPRGWEDVRDVRRWSFSAGVAVITASTIDDIMKLNSSRAKGDAKGKLYRIGAAYTLLDPQVSVLGRNYAPQFDLIVDLGLVDESAKSLFYDVNAGVAFRWREFPWNDYLYTNIMTGVGLSYTENVLQTERQRHPDRQRSHLKFYWPIELSLAHPKHRQHQMIFFLHHQSGGHIFDVGGSNLLGIGYRFSFRERTYGGTCVRLGPE